MPDTPSTSLLLRLQDTGDNVNLWGGYLNTALEQLEQAAKGYQEYTDNGDATVSWTNYSTANDFSAAKVKIIPGSSNAATTLTLPSYEAVMDVWNATANVVNLQTAAANAVAIPAGLECRVFCDGSNILAQPQFFNGEVRGSDGTAPNSFVTRSGASALIAGATTLTDNGALKVTVDDTTPKFLESAIEVGTGLTKTTVDSSGSKTVRLESNTTLDVQSANFPVIPWAKGGLNMGVADAAGARTQLGLGTSATVDTGTGSGQIALLDANGRYGVALLGSGTPSSSNVLHGDGAFKNVQWVNNARNNSTVRFWYGDVDDVPAQASRTAGLLYFGHE